MVTEAILLGLIDQLQRANELIEEQKDNLELLEEIGEDTTQERTSLNQVIEKRDRIMAAVAKRMPKQTSQKPQTPKR